MFNRGREKEKNISQYPQKLWHFSFYGGEGIEGVGEYPNKQNAEHFSERVPFSYACCDTSHPYQTTKDGKETERNMKDKNSDLLPKRGNPLNKTVTHKIGGTFYEISTVCGGDELLYDKWNGS